jgi:hypothetical protein
MQVSHGQNYGIAFQARLDTAYEYPTFLMQPAVKCC